MMRVALCAALLLALTSPALAEVILVHGTLAGDPMPEGYKYELSVVALRADGTVVYEVVGKSCTRDDDRSCQRVTIVFAPPAGSMVVQGKKAFYKQGDKQVHIGDVAGLGQVKWINLKRGAVLEATTTTARVKLDTAVLGGLSLTRVERFLELYSR